jgi:hypothetical protein
LIRSWKRLREWMQANRNFRSWQERLRSALRQWEASHNDEGALLRGALLVGAEGWLAEREAEIGPAERGFIRAGIALRERENAEREAQRQRELESAQKLAQAERQRAEDQERAGRRLRRRAILLTIALMIAAVATAAALISGLQAARQIRESQAREWAATALVTLERDPQLSLLLALQAVSATQSADGSITPEAEQALRTVLRAVDAQAALPASIDELISFARQRLTRGWTAEECQTYLHTAACPAMP